MLHLVTGLLLFAAAQGAAAGDVDCILDRYPPAERAQLVEDALAGAEGTRAMGRLEAIVGECTGRLGWNPDMAGYTAGFALALVMRDHAGAQLASAGVDTAILDQWFADQSDGVRTNPQLAESDSQNALDALLRSGASEALLDRHGETIGVYLGARIMIERVRLGLPFD